MKIEYSKKQIEKYNKLSDKNLMKTYDKLIESLVTSTKSKWDDVDIVDHNDQFISNVVIIHEILCHRWMA